MRGGRRGRRGMRGMKKTTMASPFKEQLVKGKGKRR